MKFLGFSFGGLKVVGLVLRALLTVPSLSLWDFPFSARVSVLDWYWLRPLLGTSFSRCPCFDLTLLLHLPPGWSIVLGLRPTCMNAVSILVECIRSAISGLRALASSLEAGLHNYEASLASGHLELDLESRGPLDTESRLWTSPVSSAADIPALPSSPALDLGNAYRSVEASLSRAPGHCFDLCSSISGSPEEVARRVQRAWEAGLWSKATIEGKIPKPRPTPKLTLRPNCYVVIRAPGVVGAAWVSSSREFFRLVPRFTDDTITHAFPTVEEGKVYCFGVGISFPEQRCLR